MQAGFTYFSSTVPAIVLKSLFQKYDVNCSGYLEESELRDLLERDLGLDPDQTELYSLLLDKNGDHLISFEEFVDWLRSEDRFQNIDNSSRYAILCQAVNYFKTFDVTDTDSLNREEFTMLMRSIGRPEVDMEKAFASVDQHGNGIISFWEFMKWLNWLPTMNP